MAAEHTAQQEAAAAENRLAEMAAAVEAQQQRVEAAQQSAAGHGPLQDSETPPEPEKVQSPSKNAPKSKKDMRSAVMVERICKK